MKKLVVLLLFIAIIVAGYAIKSRLPVKAACGGRNVGAGSAVGFTSVSNRNIDQVSQMNGGCGGSIVVRVDNGSVGNTDRAAQLAAYASSKGVTVIFQAVDPINAPAMADFMRSVVSSSKGVKPVLVYGNELNDNQQNDGFRGVSPAQYVALLRQVQIALATGNVSSGMILSSGTFNITHPGGGGAMSAADYVNQMCGSNVALCKEVFSNLQGYSTSSYPINTICGNSGLASYKCDESIFAKLGINISNLPIIVTETGVQNNPAWFQYGHNQAEFLAYALEYFSKNPAEFQRIYAWNIFNGLGLNNGRNDEWQIFNLFAGGQIDANVQKMLLAMKAGAVISVKDGKIVIDTEKFDECNDTSGTLIGYVGKGDAAACDDLIALFKNLRNKQRRPENVCTADNVTPSAFRPRPCENCDRELSPSNLSGSVATTPEVFAVFKIPWAEVMASPTCGGSKYVTRSWEGTLQINTDDTTVPFAGWGKASSDSALINYLADYYDGTSLYDQRKIDLTDKSPDEKKQIVMGMIQNSGVLRRLTPMSVQDDMRRKFIKRVQDQTGSLPPGNYEIRLGDDKVRVSDFYFTLDSNGRPTNRHIKPMIKDYPNTNEGKRQFESDMLAWQKLPGGLKNEPGFWEMMWYAVPMVTREDAPGALNLSIQSPPGSVENAKGGPAEFQVSFPHLARLFESTNLLAQYFKNVIGGVPNTFLNNPNTAKIKEENTQSTKTASKNGVSADSSKKVASIENRSKVLGTNSCPLTVKIQPNIQRQPGGGVKVCWNIKGNSLKQTEGGQGCDWTYKVFVNGKGVAERYLTGGNCIYKPAEKAGGTNYPGCSDTILPGSTGSVKIDMQVGSFGKNDDISTCNNADVSASVTCAVGPDGQVTGENCVPGEPEPTPTPGPVCGNNFFYSPTDVDDLGALTDSLNGKNLDVICTNPYPVTAKVVVKDDQIEIPAGSVPDEDDRGHQYIIVRTSRRIGVGATIPYLEQIWDQIKTITQSMAPDTNATAMNNGNFQAKAPVKYSFVPNEEGGLISGGVTPGDGDLYYPNLGGAACAKIYQIRSVIPEDRFKGTSLESFFDEHCKDFFLKAKTQ